MIILILAAFIGASAGLVFLLAQGAPVAVAIGAMPIAGSASSLLTSILLGQMRSRSDDLDTSL